MNTNVNLEAALGVLAFLGSSVVLVITCLVAVHAFLTKRGGRARLALAAGFGWVMIYLGVMLVFSLASHERALARGEEKHFCEIDCHLAYAVTDVQKAATLGAPQNQVSARGIFYVVTVRTRFDEKTISAHRGDGPLTPNSRVVTVLDAEGRSYGPSPEGQRALELSQTVNTPIETALRPGESYSTTFVFDLPKSVENPRLLIDEADFLTHLVIGHENSPLHGKVLFNLDEAQKQVLSSPKAQVQGPGLKTLFLLTWDSGPVAWDSLKGNM